MRKIIKIILFIIFVISSVFFGIWAYKSDLSFGEFGIYFGIIGSVASIIGLFISFFTLFKSKSDNTKEHSSLISIKKNTIENSSFGNVKGSINIGDNPTNNNK